MKHITVRLSPVSQQWWRSFWALMFLFFGLSAHAQEVDSARANGELLPPLVNLQAQARTEVAQDTIEFVLFVQKEGSDQNQVSQEVNQILKKALEQARQAAEGSEIKVYSGPFGVSPRYDDKGKITRWQARGELILESTEIDKTAELAGTLGDDLSIARMNFRLSSEERAKQEEALTKTAIQAFEQRAQLMAESLGFEHYRLKNLSIDSGGVVYQPRNAGGPQVGAMMARAEESSIAAEAGQEEVTVSIQGEIYLLDKTDTCQ